MFFTPRRAGAPIPEFGCGLRTRIGNQIVILGFGSCYFADAGATPPPSSEPTPARPHSTILRKRDSVLL